MSSRERRARVMPRIPLLSLVLFLGFGSGQRFWRRFRFIPAFSWSRQSGGPGRARKVIANGITSLPDNPETRVTSDWSTEPGTNRASNIRTNVAPVYAAATPSSDTLAPVPCRLEPLVADRSALYEQNEESSPFTGFRMAGYCALRQVCQHCYRHTVGRQVGKYVGTT